MKLTNLILIILVFLLAVPLIAHYFLNQVSGISKKAVETLDASDPENARKKLKLLDLESLKGDELKSRLDDLLRIKHSVLKELRFIEQDRAEKLKQKSEMDRLIDRLKDQATREQVGLEQLNVSIAHAQSVFKELTARNHPEVLPPLQIYSSLANNFDAQTSGFKFYITSRVPHFFRFNLLLLIRRLKPHYKIYLFKLLDYYKY